LWEASTWFPSCYIYLVAHVVKPLLNTQPDQAAIDKEAPNWHRLASILDARLANSKWIVETT
jgi:glutathione S-transferase